MILSILITLNMYTHLSATTWIVDIIITDITKLKSNKGIIGDGMGID